MISKELRDTAACALGEEADFNLFYKEARCIVQCRQDVLRHDIFDSFDVPRVQKVVLQGDAAAAE